MITEVGLDDGFAMTKVAMTDGRTFVMPSHGKAGTSGRTDLLGKSGTSGLYTTEGRQFSVGISDPESTNFPEYPHSPLNRAIVQHALQRAGGLAPDIEIASGLPVSAFYADTGKKRTAAIERKRRSLLLAVTSESCSPIGIRFHSVVPEALAAWYDFVINDEDGSPTIDESRCQSPVAVVDIGGRTTDFVVVTDQSVDHRSSGSIEAGLLDVERTVESVLSEEFDVPEVSLRLVRSAISTGQIKLFGQAHDVKPLVDPIKAFLVERVHDECRRKLGQAAELDQVLFVGGGSAALKHEINGWFPNHAIATDPGLSLIHI